MYKLWQYYNIILLYRRFYLSEHRVLVGWDFGGSFTPVTEKTTTTTAAAAAAAVAAATTTTAVTTDVRCTILYDNIWQYNVCSPCFNCPSLFDHQPRRLTIEIRTCNLCDTHNDHSGRVHELHRRPRVYIRRQNRMRTPRGLSVAHAASGREK